MTLPPRAAYNVPIDPRLLLSPKISDEAARIGIALETLFAQRDGRRKLSPNVMALEGAMSWPKARITNCLDELAGLKIISGPIDDWDWIGEPTIGGREMVTALEVADIPPKTEKLDTRLFFCRNVRPEAARLWAVTTFRGPEAAEMLTDRLGWDEDDVTSVAQELAGQGLITLTVGPGGTQIKAHKLPESGLVCVEFTSDELCKTGSSRSSKTLASLDKELAEKKRRAASRRTR